MHVGDGAWGWLSLAPKGTLLANCPGHHPRGTILFYLEDGTLQILEPRESNSGIAQGTFLKRHKVAKGRSAEFIDVEDLNVGVDLEIYGRCFHVYACDGATRAFLEREGRQVPEDQEPPVDQYHLLMQVMHVVGSRQGFLSGVRRQPLWVPAR